MNVLSSIRTVLDFLFRRRRAEREMEEELRAHLRSRADDLERQGLPRAEAERQARIEFGGYQRYKEECREALGTRLLGELIADVRYGLRQLRRNPGFTAVAVSTLALAIGANTAIFSVVDAILLKPLPYPYANHIAIILSSFGNEHRAPASGYQLQQIRRRSRVLQQIAGIWVTNSSVGIEGDPRPEPVKLADVTVGFLSMLCGRPALGRFFKPQDQAPKASTAVVISNGFWRRKFGSDPRIVGKPLHLYGSAVTILGVLPTDFRLIFPDDSSVPATPDVYLLLKGMSVRPGGPAFLRTIGRVRSGTTFAQAQAEANVIAAQMRANIKYLNAQNYQLHISPLQRDDDRNVRSLLAILFGGVGFILLIACTNVATLLLARADGRERETIVRAALGATRARIVRQLLTETVALGIFGGVAAIGVGWAVLQGLLLLRPGSLLHLGTIHLNLAALLFTFVIAVATGLVFGLAPAVGAARLEISEGLKGAGHGRPWRRHDLKKALIVLQVAISFALLTGAGLLARTFVHVLRVNPGFRPSRVLSFTTLGGDYHFLHGLQQVLAAAPGVESVSAVSHLPFDHMYGSWYDYYWPEGTPASEQSTVMADYRSVLPGYFKTIGAAFIEGRDFTDLDDPAHQHVAIVDDALARRAWPGENPLGKKLHVSDSPRGWYQFQDDWVVVVGVVHHVQYHSLTAMVRPQIYLPFQLAPRPVSFVVRSSIPPAGLMKVIRTHVSKLSSSVAIARFVSLSDLVAGARSQARFAGFLGAALAALASFLTCIGVYGVASYIVTLRTREMAIRAALGAPPSGVMRLVLVRAMAPIVFGCLVGILLSFAVTPLLASLLFGVRPIDTPTLTGAAIFLFAVGLLASFIPARRAMKVDPMVALRYE